MREGNFVITVSLDSSIKIWRVGSLKQVKNNNDDFIHKK